MNGLIKIGAGLGLLYLGWGCSPKGTKDVDPGRNSDLKAVRLADQHQSTESPQKNTPADVRSDRWGDPLPERALTRLGSLRFKQGRGTLRIAFAAHFIAACGQDGIRVWDFPSGKERLRVSIGQNIADFLGFAQNGDRLLCGCSDGVLRQWNTASMREDQPFQSRVTEGCFAVSPDGKIAAVAGATDGSIHVEDLKSAKEIRTFETHGRGVEALCFSPDGRQIASRISSNIDLWDLASDKGILRIESSSSLSLGTLAFSPDGLMIASGHDNGVIKIWDTTTGKQRASFQTPGNQPWGLSFSPDSKTIASATERSTVHRWEVETGTASTPLEGFGQPFKALAFSPDGKYIAAGGLDQLVQIWQCSTGQRVNSPSGHEGHVDSLALSPDGSLVATGGLDHSIRLWDTATGAERLKLKGSSSSVMEVAFSRDGKTVAAGCEDGVLNLWDRATGEHRLNLKGHTEAITTLAFSQDSEILASGSEDRTLRLWDLKAGKEKHVVNGFEGTVRDVLWGGSGDCVALGGSETLLELRRSANEWKSLRVENPAADQVFLYDEGRHFITWKKADHEIHFWDASQGKRIGTLKDVQGTPLGLSEDGRILFVGDDAGGIRLLELASGGEFLSVRSPLDYLYAPSIDRTCRIMASIVNDTTSLVWSMSPVEDPDTAKQWRESPPSIGELWALMGKRDAHLSYSAQWRLQRLDAGVVEFLRTQLLKRPRETVDEVRRLASDLDANQPSDRTNAQVRLDKLAPYFEEALSECMKSSLSEECRARLRAILDKLQNPVKDSAELLQRIRGLIVLERLGTDEAAEGLQLIAKASPIQGERIAAAEALRRLMKR